jgi:5-formyltetrahydrofolate cyclo-ligase
MMTGERPRDTASEPASGATISKSDGLGPAAGDRADRKRARRRELLAERRDMQTAQVTALSQQVITHLLTLAELRAARAVLLYAAAPDEIDLTTLLDASPPQFRVLLPRVEGDRLVTVAYAPGDALITGALGVREPSGPAVELSDAGIEAVVVPGVAFSPTGGRLGRGRGFYDRLLPLLPAAIRIGVCAEQFVVDDLPLEEHDVRMDVVVSDAAVRRTDAAIRRKGALDPDASA